MKRLISFLLLFGFIFGFIVCINQMSEVKKQSEKQGEKQSVVVTTVKSSSRKAEVQPAKTTETLQATNVTEKYIGNVNSYKFHKTTCKTLPYEKNRVYFQSREEAIADSYKACKKCNP